MTKKTWIIFIAAVIVLFGALLYASNRSNLDVSNVTTTNTQMPATDNGNIADHVFGKKDSKVVLIEYGDYQCPGCGSAYAPIKQVTEKYQDKMAFIFRNFPLTTLHPNARAAAGAAESAGLNGKFWEMHNKLYELQSDWENASATERNNIFAGYADSLGVSTATFNATLNDKAKQINQKIAYDQALGKKDNVSGTPTFILNGKKVEGNYKKEGDSYVLTNESNNQPVWSSADALDQLVIQPALKEAGINISK